MSFKKASKGSNLDRIVGKKASLMGNCYDAVRGILGKEEEKLKGRELTLVNTLFINTNKELASGKQKRWIRDLVKKGNLDEEVLDNLNQLDKDQASKLIEKGKNNK